MLICFLWRREEGVEVMIALCVVGWVVFVTIVRWEMKVTTFALVLQADNFMFGATNE